MSFLALDGNNFPLSFPLLLPRLSRSLSSLVLFVVSSPGLVLNVDVRDELLGYAADVRRYAVSCLQPHLEISFLLTRRPPPSLPFLSGEECRHRVKSKVGRRYHLVILASRFREHGCVYRKNFLRFTSLDRQHLLVIYCNQLLFSFPVGVSFPHICGIMLEDGRDNQGRS